MLKKKNDLKANSPVDIFILKYLHIFSLTGPTEKIICYILTFDRQGSGGDLKKKKKKNDVQLCLKVN